MQSHRTAGSPPAPSSEPGPWTGRVLGLGVTDVLRIELAPEHLPSLVEQLDVLRDVYDDTVVHERARWAAIPEFAREARLPSAVHAEKDLEGSEFDVEALDIIRGQLVKVGRDEARPVAIYGPSRIIAELVRETTLHAAANLNELVARQPLNEAEARARLVAAATAAKAWAEIYVECAAVEWFKFDLDPAPTGA